MGTGAPGSWWFLGMGDGHRTFHDTILSTLVMLEN